MPRRANKTCFPPYSPPASDHDMRAFFCLAVPILFACDVRADGPTAKLVSFETTFSPYSHEWAATPALVTANSADKMAFNFPFSRLTRISIARPSSRRHVVVHLPRRPEPPYATASITLDSTAEPNPSTAGIAATVARAAEEVGRVTNSMTSASVASTPKARCGDQRDTLAPCVGIHVQQRLHWR